MQEHYTFQGGSEKQFREIPIEILPDGDYDFAVLSADEPYFKPDTQRWVMRTVLRIDPKGHELSYSPSTSITGSDRDGVKRDAIGDFCIGVNRAPKQGDEIEVGRLIGARGRCRLKREMWKEHERNAVAWIHVPKQLAEQLPKVGPKPPSGPDDLDMAPSDIPF